MTYNEFDLIDFVKQKYHSFDNDCFSFQFIEYVPYPFGTSREILNSSFLIRYRTSHSTIDNETKTTIAAINRNELETWLITRKRNNNLNKIIQ